MRIDCMTLGNSAVSISILRRSLFRMTFNIKIAVQHINANNVYTDVIEAPISHYMQEFLF